MAMQEYKIVNATQLDSDLAELASVYRDTFSISTTTPLTFPESFIETVDNIEKRDSYSLKLVDKTITAPAGYYKLDGVLTLPADYVDTSSLKKNSGDMTFNNKIITAPAGYYEADATYTLPVDYVDTSSLKRGSADMTFSDKTITAPAGYYEANATYILPDSYIDVEPLTKDSNDLTFVADTVIVPAGYYATEAQYGIPASYIDTTDITVTTFADATTIAAALPAGTQVTIPAGYYPNGIVIVSSQVQETPPAE